jgi:hypothetical protein
MCASMEKNAHMALTVLCSQNLPTTVGTLISLYLIKDHAYFAVPDQGPL